MRPDKYKRLPDGTAVPCEDLLEWARWYEVKENRVVAYDRLPGDVLVSTVFLGLDMNFRSDGPPVLWETMIFGGPQDQYQARYMSEAQALAGHQVALELAKTGKEPS